MRLVHLINGLGKGGAENTLFQIIRYRSNTSIEQKVISLGMNHFYEDKIEAEGIPVIDVGIKHNPIKALLKISHIVRDADVLNCWLYHSNFIGGLMMFLHPHIKVIWNIRHSNLSPAYNKKGTLLINKVCALMSGLVHKIAYNGKRAQMVHEAIGYKAEAAVVLDNGCDIDEYCFKKLGREKLLHELDIRKNKRIILSLTKDAPIKDWPSFVKAFAKCKMQKKDIVAVMCGQGIVPDNVAIINACNELGLKIGEDIFLLGLRHDVPELLSAADLYVLHSAGEAFPNSLLQAMSCGCLSITTDVGDARRIINDECRVIIPGDIQALADKIITFLGMGKNARDLLKKADCERVKKYFNIRDIVKAYEKMYTS